MTIIEEAIKHYHSLLKGSFADDAQARLDAATRQHNLQFGARPICTVLRPFFITAAQYDEAICDSTLVLTAIEKLSAALLADPTLRLEIDLTPDEEKLVEIDPGYRAPDASGRLDAFLDLQGGFHFVEYNADSPGGLLYGDVLSEAFLEMEVVKQFARQYPVRRVPIRPKILGTLLRCYREWGGIEYPQIAIVDWREVKTRAEFEISQAYFESEGFRTIIVDPDELEYSDGKLKAGDFQIQLVYKRVVTGELLARGGLDHPLVRAARDRAVCVVNALRVQLIFKKSLFALLDDPANDPLFTTDEIGALRRRIPWTRRLREGWTTYHQRRVDLLDFVAASRDRFVIKPNGDYGGRGVTLGWECSDEEWRQAIEDALGASFVVQERVEVREESFPSMIDGEIKLANRYVDFDPYTWCGDEVEGAGVRLSSSALLNVTAGGGSAAPLLIIE
jgi:uncharacterized circularly permuted ATP-grasp superfamily protein